jgi:hypothetical protein
MNFRKNHKQAAQSGQNLAELALILPVMVIILFGVLDLGRIFYAQIAVANAAREGVRYLTTHPADRIGGYINSIDAAEMQATFSGLDSEGLSVIADCTFADDDGGCEAGRELSDPDNKAVVTVTYDFRPILGWVLPEVLTLSESATMVVP